jgi:hypothetical protein
MYTSVRTVLTRSSMSVLLDETSKNCWAEGLLRTALGNLDNPKTRDKC